MALNPKRGWLFGSAVLAAVTLTWSSGNQSVAARTQFIGNDRLVSRISAEEVLGEDALGLACPYPGYTASGVVAAAPQQQAGSGVGPQTQWPIAGLKSTGPRIGTRAGMLDRKPARFIWDPNPAFAGIAVNAANDMVMVIDENNHGRILEYSRRDNTPSGGPPTSPRRIIQGLNTFNEMPCGVYLDPKTLEVAVLNGDTQNWMPVFSREARGNADPVRTLAMPQTSWGIAADELRQEFFMTVESPNAVIVHRKNAVGTEAPLRAIQGEATQLANPQGIAVDTRNNLIAVANLGFLPRSTAPPGPPLPYDEWRRRWEESMAGEGLHSFVGLTGGGRGGRSYGQFDLPSITIFPLNASGNAAPVRVIKGPRTQLNWPHHVAINEADAEIFVANNADNSILVFRLSDNGDVAPTRVIKGSGTGLVFPTGVAVDATNSELWVANMGNYTATAYPLASNGNVAPLRTIRGGPAGGRFNMMGNPGAVEYDSQRGEILVPN
jgi:DNA-binding beta-propeller fold protein YncE